MKRIGILVLVMLLAGFVGFVQAGEIVIDDSASTFVAPIDPTLLVGNPQEAAISVPATDTGGTYYEQIGSSASYDVNVGRADLPTMSNLGQEITFSSEATAPAPVTQWDTPTPPFASENLAYQQAFVSGDLRWDSPPANWSPQPPAVAPAPKNNFNNEREGITFDRFPQIDSIVPSYAARDGLNQAQRPTPINDGLGMAPSQPGPEVPAPPPSIRPPEEILNIQQEIFRSQQGIASPVGEPGKIGPAGIELIPQPAPTPMEELRPGRQYYDPATQNWGLHPGAASEPSLAPVPQVPNGQRGDVGFTGDIGPAGPAPTPVMDNDQLLRDSLTDPNVPDEARAHNAAVLATTGDLNNLNTIVNAALQEHIGINEAADALREVPDQRVVTPYLLDNIYSPQNQEQRARAAELAEALNPDGFPDMLFDIQTNPNLDDERLRLGAASMLATRGDPRALAPLTEALSSENPEFRSEAVDALGMLRSPKSISDLIAALADTDRGVRASAALSLGRYGPEVRVQAIQPLTTALLEDGSRSVRVNAALALGRIGGEIAEQSLLAVATDRDETVRTAVRVGLERARGR